MSDIVFVNFAAGAVASGPWSYNTLTRIVFSLSNMKNIYNAATTIGIAYGTQPSTQTTNAVAVKPRGYFGEDVYDSFVGYTPSNTGTITISGLTPNAPVRLIVDLHIQTALANYNDPATLTIGGTNYTYNKNTNSTVYVAPIDVTVDADGSGNIVITSGDGTKSSLIDGMVIMDNYVRPATTLTTLGTTGAQTNTVSLTNNQSYIMDSQTYTASAGDVITAGAVRCGGSGITGYTNAFILLINNATNRVEFSLPVVLTGDAMTDYTAECAFPLQAGTTYTMGVGVQGTHSVQFATQADNDTGSVQNTAISELNYQTTTLSPLESTRATTPMPVASFTVSGTPPYTIVSIDGDNNVQAGQTNVDIIMSSS